MAAVITRAHVARFATVMGCTVEQALQGYARNAEQLARMAEHPKRANGARYQGYTADELRASAARYAAVGRGEFES